MGVLKALRFYSSLSPEQKEFIREKKTEDTQSVEQWLRFLTRAAAYDEYGDETRKKLKPILVILWLLLVVAIVLLIFIVEDGINYWNIGVIGLIILLLIFYHYAFSKLKHRDLTNQLRLFFVPLLRILMHKAGKEARLSAKLNFSNFLSEKPITESGNGSRKIDLYQPRFILSKIKLLDLSLMEFAYGDDHRKLTIRKTGSSGKTKIKVKHKITHQVFLKMSFPKSYYVLSDTPGGAVIVEEEEFFVVKRKLKVKSDDKEAVLKIEDFLALVDELYKTVKIKPGSKLPVPEKIVDDKTRARQDDEIDFDDDEIESGATFMIWGAYFSEVDYLGFEGEHGGYYMAEEDADTFFDS